MSATAIPSAVSVLPGAWLLVRCGLIDAIGVLGILAGDEDLGCRDGWLAEAGLDLDAVAAGECVRAGALLGLGTGV